MPRFNTAIHRHSFDRFLRSPVARCVMAVVLIPMMVITAFGGTTFLAHAHVGHGTHLHAVATRDADRFCAEQHDALHASGSADHDHKPADTDHKHDFPSPVEEPEGLVITIPDHEIVAPRGVDVASVLKAVQVVQFPTSVLWETPDIAEVIGSPGGASLPGPRHLCALSAGQRLVRTSRALLI